MIRRVTVDFVIDIIYVQQNLKRSLSLGERQKLPFFSNEQISFSSANRHAGTICITQLNRHIGPNEAETQEMLKVLEVKSIQELLQQAIPSTIRDPNCLEDNSIGSEISEHEFLHKMRNILQRNKLNKCYIGNGYYPTITPSVIQRNLL